MQKRLVIAVGLDVGIVHHAGDFSGKCVVRVDQSGNESSERPIKFKGLRISRLFVRAGFRQNGFFADFSF